MRTGQVGCARAQTAMRTGQVGVSVVGTATLLDRIPGSLTILGPDQLRPHGRLIAPVDSADGSYQVMTVYDKVPMGDPSAYSHDEEHQHVTTTQHDDDGGQQYIIRARALMDVAYVPLTDAQAQWPTGA